MRMKVVSCLGAVLLLTGMAATPVVKAADDPSNGTWKLNIEKSKFDPGPAPKSGTVTITIGNGTETYNGETTDASGKTTNMSFKAQLDGTDATLTGTPMGDTISIKHPSPNKLVGSIKQGGKVLITVHVTVSADGKTRTVTETGKTPDGKPVHSVMVYDKQ
jgi:hypothetical protein